MNATSQRPIAWRTLSDPNTRAEALIAGLLLWGGTLTITVGGGFITKAAMPGTSGTMRALVVTAVLSAAVLAVRRRYGPWSGLGVNRPTAWAKLGLLVLPLLLALSPLAFGVRNLEATTWLVLLTGYALTGFTEELAWRGIAQRVLRPLGPARGPLVASALFGLAHLGNVLYRDSVALVAAQAWGAFCFGVGYAALRQRTRSIVPLMGLHLLTDLCAAVSVGPAIALLVAQDVVLLTVGAVMLTQDARAVPRASTTSKVIGQSKHRSPSLG
jgi:membrane protease YdiL (CAAX protease family)